MKKNLTRILLLAMAMVLALGLCLTAQAEAEPEAAEAWLLYFASNHETDSSKWPWWPQHQRVDQPSSETGVEYTNALIYGPGHYTAALKFNWQKAEGAIQFNLILNNAEKLFPGYYCEITDIRVNGESIEVGENLYGAYHDDPNAGMVSIYNSYWDTQYEPSATGPSGHRAWDNEESAHWLIINPDDIVNGSTIEVDFFFTKQAGVEPAAVPTAVSPELADDEAVPSNQISEENSANAYIHYIDQDWWPAAAGKEDTYWKPQTALITGEGHYTVGLEAHMPDWFYSGGNSNVGAQKLAIVIPDGSSKFPGMHMQITDIRIDGVSYDIGDVTYGQTGYDNSADDGTVYWAASDTYGLIYDSWMANPDNGGSIWGGTTWDSSATAQNFNIFDVSNLNNPKNIEIDFFLSAEQDVVPEVQAEWTPKYDFTFYRDNTMGVAGLWLRDMGVTDKWYNVVPVNLTTDGVYTYPLVASARYILGDVTVVVQDGQATVNYSLDYHTPGAININSECLQWFASIDEITSEYCENPTGEYAFGEAADLSGMGDLAYLFICNRVTYCQPVTNTGKMSPEYWSNAPAWVSYREALNGIVEALAPVAEVPAE